MQLVQSLLQNLGLLALAVVLIFLVSAKFDLVPGSATRLAIKGLLYGFASVIVVQFPIEGPLGSSFDTRAAPVLISGFFGGAISGTITAVIGAIARYNVGGPTAIGGAVSFGLYLIAALVFRKFFYPRRFGVFGFAIFACCATMAVVPSFFIGQTIETGWRIIASFWPVLLAGNLIGTIILGLIVEQIRVMEDGQREAASIIKASPDGIITVDKNMQILTFNPSATKMFGWRESEIVGRKIETLIPTQHTKNHADQAREFLNDNSAVSREMTGYRVVYAKRKNEEVFPVLISLSKYWRSYENIVVATVHDMTVVQSAKADLTKMSEQLARQLKDAIATNESKNRFLANMSHELRTPLNAIIGFSGFLESTRLGIVTKEKTMEYLADIRRSGEELLAMINDVIDIAKIEEDRIDFAVAPLNVKIIADRAVKLTEAHAQSRGITIDQMIDAELALGDHQAVQQVLTNLLTNSIKYSSPGTKVAIRSQRQSGRVAIIVEDEGIGIPQSIIDRVGEPFLRGEAPEVRSTDGSGLGLVLSKRFMEKLNVELRLERKPVGGTRATVLLPEANTVH
jgi:PAS domain S-box-containing protein